MPGYDSAGYDPPAPVATVSLRPSAGQGLVGDVRMLIDTGADITLLPRWAVNRLGITPPIAAQYQLIGIDGTRRRADAVDLDMLLLDKAFRGRYLLTDETEGVIGRDVLSSLRLLLDGPAQEWSQHPTG
jgi:hypothetical protein